jgi:predicted transposase/invertase (TIGR01784 family)
LKKDEKWKSLISKYLEDFLSFFMPELYNQVDFTKGYEFLDGELNKIKIKSKSKNRRSDKLVKVYLKDGTEQYLLVHMEIQGYFEENFADRMLTYYYRISDLHQTRNITAISVYIEDDKDFKPSSVEYSNFGTRILYEFNTYKILEQKENKLKKSNNIFAFVVLAVLYSLKAKDNQKTKLDFKIKLTKLLLEKNYNQEEIEELFEFINLFLSFSNEKYDNLFYEELEKMPKTKEKEALNSFEKFLLKKGKNQEKVEIAINTLKEGASIEFTSKITGLTLKEVEELSKNLK